MNLLRCSGLIQVPWKNGGGATREIATGRIGDQAAWRISRADVGQDGAFSDFAGLTCILTLVSGRGMVLKYNGGPLTDLNRMFDRPHCAGEVITLRGPCA